MILIDFHPKKVYKGPEHMKIRSTSLVIRKMQTHTIMKYHKDGYNQKQDWSY